MYILGLILSAFIGLSLGLIGGGGSILTVPILVYFLGVEAGDAVAMSLAVVGSTSLFSSILHWKRDNLDFSSGLLFGVSGICGAFLGSPLTHLTSPPVLLLIFAALMFVAALSMFFRKRNNNDEIPHETNVIKAVAAGFGVGVLTGFLGVGGGFLIVPALILFGGLTMKKAVGTSLLVIFMNCVAGLLGHNSQADFDWHLTLTVMALAVGGAIFGTLLSQRIKAQRLQKMFALLVFAVALFLFAKNYGVLL